MEHFSGTRIAPELNGLTRPEAGLENREAKVPMMVATVKGRLGIEHLTSLNQSDSIFLHPLCPECNPYPGKDKLEIR